MKILDIINGRSFYSQNVANVNEEKNLVLADESEFLKPNLMFHDVNIENYLNDETRKIYYISDIHINHKLLQKFPHYTSRKKYD